MYNRPVIITCAITGNRTTRAIAPVPLNPQEQAKSSEGSINEGASIIHLHVREDNGEESLSSKRYSEAISLLKKIKIDPIIEITPRGTDFLAQQGSLKFERGNLVEVSADMWGNKPELRPDICALNLSSRNIDETTILLNPPHDVKAQIERIYSLGLVPRCDVYDIGDIRFALGLLEQGILKAPMHFLLIFGSYSGIGASTENLKYMVEQLPAGTHWTAIGTGSRYNYEIARQAILLGGHIRTGFEDETYICKGQKAKSNAELVAKYAKLCEELGRPVATPEQAREILGLVPAQQEEVLVSQIQAIDLETLVPIAA